MDDVNVTDQLPPPTVPVVVVPEGSGEAMDFDTMVMHVIEDGSHTDMRIGIILSVLQPGAKGPSLHWHEMHDEVFMVKQGSIRFTVRGEDGKEKFIDARAGDSVVVPPRSVHTFENASNEEASFIATMTPAFYINYFRLLHNVVKSGKQMTKEVHSSAMAKYATITTSLPR